MSEPLLNRKFIEMVKLLNVYLNHFPKHEKHALSQLIRCTAYELYDLISEGQKRYQKKTTLTNLDITHERLRMQIYLAYELGYFRFKDGKQSDKKPEELEAHRFSAIGSMVDEIGKMIGGKIKKGINFVGFRTWRSRIVIRKHSLFKFKRRCKRGDQSAINSILGHAKRTNSLPRLISIIKENIQNGKNLLIPTGYRSIYELQSTGATLCTG